MNKKMNEKIPKKIHYCWFGGSPLPKKLQEYIDGWRRKFPDYEIIEWNESNFDVNKIKFTKEAYKEKKYAFVSDVARLKALYEYGGIYLDTDVEVVKDLTPLLVHNAFLGVENSHGPQENMVCGSAIIGTVPNNILIKKMLKYYENINFINENGSFNMEPNVFLLTSLIKKEYNWIPGNEFKDFKELVIYPGIYFYPEINPAGQVIMNEKTYTIHYFESTWRPFRVRVKRKIRHFVGRILGEKKTKKILEIIRDKNWKILITEKEREDIRSDS